MPHPLHRSLRSFTITRQRSPFVTPEQTRQRPLPTQRFLLGGLLLGVLALLLLLVLRRVRYATPVFISSKQREHLAQHTDACQNSEAACHTMLAAKTPAETGVRTTAKRASRKNTAHLPVVSAYEHVRLALQTEPGLSLSQLARQTGYSRSYVCTLRRRVRVDSTVHRPMLHLLPQNTPENIPSRPAAGA